MTFSEWKKKNSPSQGQTETSGESFASWKANKIVNDNYIKSFVDEANDYYKSSAADYDKLTWDNAGTTLKDREKSYQNLSSKANVIGTWLESNKGKIDDESYKSLSDTLASFKKDGLSVVDRFKNYYDFTQDFYSAEEFDAYVKDYEQNKDQYKAEHDALLSFDTKLGQEHIDIKQNAVDAQERIDALRRLQKSVSPDFWGTMNTANQTRYDEYEREISDLMPIVNQALSMYGVSSIDELKEMLFSEREYLQNAKKAQKKAELEAVADPESEYYDPDFDRYSIYTGGGNEVIQYVNAGEAERKRLLKMYPHLEKVVDTLGLDYFNNKEKELFNYYYQDEQKWGADKVQEYTDALAETLNTRRGRERYYTSLKDQKLLQDLFIASSSIEGFFNDINNLLFVNEALPTSAEEVALGLIREERADKGLPWYNFATGEWKPIIINGSTTEQLAQDALSTTTRMLPSILAAVATELALPTAGEGAAVFSALMTPKKVGQAVGSLTMGASAAGAGKQEMLRLGYSVEQATTYGLMIGAAETLMERLLGGIAPVGGDGIFSGLFGKLSSAALGKIDNALARVAITLGSHVAGNAFDEALEEGLQTLLEPWLKQIATGGIDFEDPSVDEVLYNSLLGAVSSLFFSGAEIGGTAISNAYGRGQAINAHGNEIIENNGVDPLKKLALEMTDAEANKNISRAVKRVDKKATPKSVGKLSATMEKAIRTKNKTAVESALVSKGLTAKEARIAAKYILDEEITEGQRNILETNQRYREAIDSALYDSDGAEVGAESIKLAEARAGDKLKKTSPDDLNTDTESDIIGKGTPNEESEETDGVRIRDGGERDRGTDTSGQVLSVEGGARPYPRRRESGRIADREAARLVNEGREVSVASLGIAKGSKLHTVRLVETDNETASMKKARKEAESRGLIIKFFVGGNLVIEEDTDENVGRADKDKTYFEANGYIRGNVMLVRADHHKFTADQIARHEAGHDKIAKGEIDVDAVRARLVEIVGEENVDLLAENYALAYAGSNYDEAQIWEECICDSLGDMNIFATNTEAAETMAIAIPEIKTAIKDTSKSPTQTRGSPEVEGKASREAKSDYSEYDKPITISDVEVLRSIGRKSINKFTSEEIKKAQKWAYKFYKELGVKSPFFRAWFGEWRMYDKTPIVNVDIDRDAIIASGNAINNDMKRKFSWSKDVAKESILNAPKEHKEEIAIIAANLSRIVEESILLDTVVSDNRSNRKLPGTSWMHSLYSIVKLDGKVSLIKLFAEEAFSEKQNQSFTRAYSLKYIEKVAEFDDGVLSNKGGLTDSHSATIKSIADLYEFVKTYDKDFSVAPEVNEVLLNQDGTPKVFYHGSGAKFTEFRPEEMSSVEGSYFFAENKEDAAAYGKNIYEVYLSARKLADYDNQPSEFYRLKNKRAQVSWLKEKGYDGWYADMDSEGWAEISVFSPEQAKSATDNVGTFSKGETDIHYSREIDANNGRAVGVNYKLSVRDYSLQEITHIYKRGKLGAEYDVLFDRLCEYCRNAGVKFSVVPEIRNKEGNRVPGVARGNKISFSQSDFNSTNMPDKVKSDVILHEMLHTATVYAIRIYDQAKRRGETAKLPKHINNSCKEIYRVYASIKDDPLFKNEYGIKNPKEMVACITQPDFAAKLKSSYPSAWHQLLEAICKILGINKTFTNYDKLTKAVDEILTHPDYALSSKHDSLASKNAHYLEESEYTDLSNYSRELDVIDYMDELAEREGREIVEPKVMSDRELLVNALESIAQDHAERKKLEEYKANIDKMNAESEKLAKLKAEIKELTFGKDKTKRDPQKLKELRAEATKTENRINIYDKRLLNLETASVLKDVLQREKRKAFKAAAERGLAALHRNVEGRNKTVLRHKIQRVARELEARLDRGTKEKNVKKELSPLVRSALDLSDLLFTTDEELIVNGFGTIVTGAEQEAVDRYLELYEEYHSYDDAVTDNKELRKDLRHEMNEVKKDLAGAIERERIRISEANASDTFDTIIKEYESLAKAENSYISAVFEEDKLDHIKALKEKVGDTLVKDMTLEQLEAVYKAFRIVQHSVSESNKLFGAEQSHSREELGTQLYNEIVSHGEKGKMVSLPGKAYAEFDYNNLKPIWLGERLGSPTLQRLMDAIFAGESEWAALANEAKKYKAEQKERFNFKKWDFKKTWSFKTPTGQTYELNLEQMLTIYAYAQRGEQAMNHLMKDGFVFDKLVVKKGVVKYELNDKTAYALDEKTLFEIIGNPFTGKDGILTGEQKSYVDAMQRYLSDELGKKGNVVSSALYGIDLFDVENYLPIRSEQAYLERAREKAKGTAKITSRGFTKPTTDKASNAIVLSEFDSLWNDHSVSMSEYIALSIPITNFSRVYNWQNKTSDGSAKVGVISAINNAYGSSAQAAIDHLLEDINGGARSDYREGPVKAATSAFKKAKVMLSLSVVVQQPSAILRAQAMISPKYFAPIKLSKEKHKAQWDELKTYAPVAIIKEMGYFDIGMGKTTAKWIDGESTVREKIDEWTSKGAAFADEVTWLRIWDAVKRETLHNNPKLSPKSKEFLTIAGRRFEDVIRHTQVYDSTLSRSANMRSKSAMMQMVTSFLAEGTTSINMREMALRSKDKGRIARTTAAVYASALLNAFLVALPYAFRDDDEDETFAEKYMEALTSNFVSNINPLTSLPIIKDIWSISLGYKVERADMSLIADLFTSATNILNEALKETPNEQKLIHYAHELVSGIANLRGIPLENAIREVKSILNFGKMITDGEYWETTWEDVYKAIIEGAKSELPFNRAWGKTKK